MKDIDITLISLNFAGEMMHLFLYYENFKLQSEGIYKKQFFKIY